MTLNELIVLAQGETQNALVMNEYNLAALTGYLLIAYFIGANLTLFQVTFVNVVFVLQRAASYLSLQGILRRTSYFQERVSAIDSDIPMGQLALGGSGGTIQTILFIAITVGALVFMWQVRHPKSE